MGIGVLVACGAVSFVIRGVWGVSTYAWDKPK